MCRLSTGAGTGCTNLHVMATFARDRTAPPGIPLAGNPAVRAGEVVIGPTNLRDVPEVARLHRRCFRKALAYRLSTLFILRLMPGNQFLVACDGDRIVGNVIGDYRGGQSRVISICVDPTYRERGIGSRLLSAIEDALPHGNMILMVESTNAPAQLLYRAHGYLAVGESRDYYGRGRHGIWMQKSRPM
ncbi:MAG: GNAT family N-acetyltransferase [Chloroflexota bacterium]|nr:GNAT family N-acetyltransferase [Chloroflexota bacterium]